jgi:hypothetical protein
MCGNGAGLCPWSRNDAVRCEMPEMRVRYLIPASKGKSDLILNTVLRMEKFLQEMNSKIVSLKPLLLDIKNSLSRDLS